MLVLMAVMKIGSVRMCVCSTVVSVNVAMLAFHRGHVHVLMMPVVVAVHVLVLHGRVPFGRAAPRRRSRGLRARFGVG